MAKLSKRIKAWEGKIDADKQYAADDALNLA